MASCQTWVSPSYFQHRWFPTSAVKRKYRDVIGQDEDSDSTPFPNSSSTSRPRPKRARCTVLENGLAHLSIAGNAYTPTYATYSPATVGPPGGYPVVEDVTSTPSMDADMSSSSTYSSPIIQPTYIVEEPPIPEVKMKVSSWYEPEPDRTSERFSTAKICSSKQLLSTGIVITDLDSFTQSDDEDEQEVTVNPALLECIRNNTLGSPKVTTAPTTSQALVLYRPLPNLRDTNEDHEEEEKVEEALVQLDDDAMDVEP